MKHVALAMDQDDQIPSVLVALKVSLRQDVVEIGRFSRPYLLAAKEAS